MNLVVLTRFTILITFVGHVGWVLAADEVLTPDMIPLVKYLYAIGLSFWGGIAAYLQRFAAGTETAKWYTLLARDSVSSTLAGVLTFLGCTHFQVPPLLAAIMISVCGYGGSRTLEAYFNRAAKQIEEQK